MSNKNEIIKLNQELTQKACDVLKGKTIVAVGYVPDNFMQAQGWWKRPVFFKLNDGTVFIPFADDEGNDGGSLFYYKGEDSGLIPTSL